MAKADFGRFGHFGAFRFAQPGLAFARRHRKSVESGDQKCYTFPNCFCLAMFLRSGFIFAYFSLRIQLHDENDRKKLRVLQKLRIGLPAEAAPMLLRWLSPSVGLRILFS